MSQYKFYIVKVDEFESSISPWFQMQQQYAIASKNYEMELRREPRKGEDPRMIPIMAEKNFSNECDSIKSQHPDVDAYPVPLTINGRKYLDDVDGTKRLIMDRNGDTDHSSLFQLSYKSPVYDQKTIKPLLISFR